MSDTPRTDAMEARVSSECRNLSDETRNWLMQAKSRELNCTLERELAAVKEQLAEARRDAERYRVYRLYKTSGAWPSFRGQEPGLCAWGGTHAGKEYTGEVIDKMMDEMLASKYSRPILDAAMKEPA